MRYKTTILLILFCVVASAQTDLWNIEFSGKVHENGKGIANVPVTDGYNIVLTDQKGNYKLVSNTTAGFVYITIPSGYKIPIENNVPCFYREIKDKSKIKQRFDFALQREAKDNNKHTFIVWADPQVYFDEEIPMVADAAKDVADLVKGEYSDVPVYGLVCGDMVSDINKGNKYNDDIKKILAATEVPFFYALGNHDMNVGVRSNELSKKTYHQHYGPAYYSFNRGKVHYIVLDNVFNVGKGYSYIGYLPEEQLNWLQQDLQQVPKGSTVIVSMHIPTYSREARRKEYNKEGMQLVLQNRNALYKMLEGYNTHIFSAHEHYTENYLIKDNIYEHVHGALCGLFWQTPWNHDGTPLGYTVYEIDGDKVSWYTKAVGEGKDYQFRAYIIGSNIEKPHAITVNVWNYDPAWKVYWYENGICMGEMQQYAGHDMSLYYYARKNKDKFKHKWISARPTEHMFFAIPKDKDAEIKVEVTDRFGNSYTRQPIDPR